MQTQDPVSISNDSTVIVYKYHVSKGFERHLQRYELKSDIKKHLAVAYSAAEFYLRNYEARRLLWAFKRLMPYENSVILTMAPKGLSHLTTRARSSLPKGIEVLYILDNAPFTKCLRNNLRTVKEVHLLSPCSDNYLVECNEALIRSLRKLGRTVVIKHV